MMLVVNHPRSNYPHRDCTQDIDDQKCGNKALLPWLELRNEPQDGVAVRREHDGSMTLSMSTAVRQINLSS